MNATIQFANGDALDLESWVSTTLTTPVTLQLDNAGGRVCGGTDEREAANDVYWKRAA